MSDKDSTLRVECVSESCSDRPPTRFFLGKRKIEIGEIVDRWIGKNYAYYKVRGDDDCIYILHHAVDEYRWSLRLFDSGRRPAEPGGAGVTAPSSGRGRLH